MGAHSPSAWWSLSQSCTLSEDFLGQSCLITLSHFTGVVLQTTLFFYSSFLVNSHFNFPPRLFLKFFYCSQNSLPISDIKSERTHLESHYPTTLLSYHPSLVFYSGSNQNHVLSSTEEQTLCLRALASQKCCTSPFFLIQS